MVATNTMILHLSDIHFHKGSGGLHDEDRDLRNEILRDIRAQGSRRGAVRAVLVTGDIAFSGQSSEYEAAARWLKEVCHACGCPEESVWLTPGNHDVDRGLIDKSPLLRDTHAKVRGLSRQAADLHLRQYLEDAEAGPMLFKPLLAYNEFAARFECALDPGRPYWETDLLLNDGSTLRLRGLNSALLSDRHDDEKRNELLLGAGARTLLRQDGVEYMTLCHHPPTHLVDRDEVQDMFDNRVRIQLYGHKHQQRCRCIDGKTVVITAGAVHPERGHDWQPRYNFLSVSVQVEAGARRMVVQVYPRVFRQDTHEFQAEHDRDGKEERRYEMALDGWTRPAQVEIMEGYVSSTSAQPPAAQAGPASPPRSSMTPMRRLTYRLLSLPYHLRLQAAQKLDLIQDEDRRASDVELCKRILTRANERHLLRQLWDEVTRLQPDGAPADNPFPA